MTGRRGAAWVLTAAVGAVLVLSGCTAAEPAPTEEPVDVTPPSAPEVQTTTFAITSDYGGCDEGAHDVAAMVMSWNPAIIATAGDNSQGVAGCTPFTASVGDLYGSYIHGPDGPRFFPSPGNHDYEDEGAGEAAYLEYFSYLRAITDTPLWYRVEVGNANLFLIDSETPEDQLEVQREWLRTNLEEASADPGTWNIVVFHRPPYTSGPHEPNTAMRPEAGWDYAGWGADLVVTGHQHVFESLEVDGLPYIVSGVGATSLIRPCPEQLVPESDGCYEGIGALHVTAASDALTLEYRVPDGGAGRTVETVEVSRDG